MTPIKQTFTETNQPCPQNNGGVYEIKIRGFLDDHWQQWFEGMTLNRQQNVEEGQDYTLISGAIADQPALHGLLAKIRDLNLTLISVRKVMLTDQCDEDRAQKAEQSD